MVCKLEPCCRHRLLPLNLKDDNSADDDLVRLLLQRLYQDTIARTAFTTTRRTTASATDMTKTTALTITSVPPCHRDDYGFTSITFLTAQLYMRVAQPKFCLHNPHLRYEWQSDFVADMVLHSTMVVHRTIREYYNTIINFSDSILA